MQKYGTQKENQRRYKEIQLKNIREMIMALHRLNQVSRTQTLGQ